MAQSNQELEAKFYLANLFELREKLEALEAKLIQPRTYERNLRFDTPERILTQSTQVLRLRRDTANRLTYKGPGKIKDGVSARVEIEVTVGDFENARKLLEALGYKISMIYEKYRTIFDLNGVLVTLDEMPFGFFAEIEGEDGESIQAVCHQLGLIWELRTLQSYAMLFEIVKKNLGLQFRDLTFESFAEIKVKPRHLELAPADLKA
jgi:adenylate cyclase class 2